MTHSFIAVIGLLAAASLCTALTGCARDDGGSSVSQRQFSCRAHPDIVMPNPGLCPICGEPLRPVEARPAGTLAERAPDLDEQRDH